MRWRVEDPKGLEHIVEWDHFGIWHGTDNLGHHLTKGRERDIMVARLLDYILDEDATKGDWNGYSWIKMS